MENLYNYNVTLRYWSTKRWLEIHSMKVGFRFLLVDNLEFRLLSLIDNILHQLICEKTSTCLHYIIYCTFSIPAGSSDFLPSTICDEYPVKKKEFIHTTFDQALLEKNVKQVFETFFWHMCGTFFFLSWSLPQHHGNLRVPQCHPLTDY